MGENYASPYREAGIDSYARRRPAKKKSKDYGLWSMPRRIPRPGHSYWAKEQEQKCGPQNGTDQCRYCHQPRFAVESYPCKRKRK